MGKLQVEMFAALSGYCCGRTVAAAAEQHAPNTAAVIATQHTPNPRTPVPQGGSGHKKCVHTSATYMSYVHEPRRCHGFSVCH